MLLFLGNLRLPNMSGWRELGGGVGGGGWLGSGCLYLQFVLEAILKCLLSGIGVVFKCKELVVWIYKAPVLLLAAGVTVGIRSGWLLALCPFSGEGSRRREDVQVPCCSPGRGQWSEAWEGDSQPASLILPQSQGLDCHCSSGIVCAGGVSFSSFLVCTSMSYV